MADTFVMSARQAAELDHAFERNGWTPTDVKTLSKGGTLAEFRKVLLGHAIITALGHFIDCDADPYVPAGWKVFEHRKGGQFNFSAALVKFRLDSGQKNGEYIGGNKLCKKFLGKPILNANVLDYLLKNPDLIPEDWKRDENGNARYIFFWGTIYRYSYGHTCVRYLGWNDKWCWGAYWLDDEFGRDLHAALRVS